MRTNRNNIINLKHIYRRAVQLIDIFLKWNYTAPVNDVFHVFPDSFITIQQTQTPYPSLTSIHPLEISNVTLKRGEFLRQRSSTTTP